MAYGQYSLQGTTLPQVILVDIGLACMQASPDLAHGARVQIVARLEENTEQAKEIGATCHIFRDIDVFSAFPMVLRPAKYGLLWVRGDNQRAKKLSLPRPSSEAHLEVVNGAITS